MKSPLLGLAIAFLLCLGAVGCSSSNNPLAGDPVTAELSGAWYYQMNNTPDATFINCTGDVAHLNGMTYFDAMLGETLCTPSRNFDVTQTGDTFVIQSHAVTCGDGSIADATGSGVVNGNTVAGQWDTLTTSGVASSQSFTATVNPSMLIEIVESSRTFTGTLQGSCELSPALNSSAVVQAGN